MEIDWGFLSTDDGDDFIQDYSNYYPEYYPE